MHRLKFVSLAVATVCICLSPAIPLGYRLRWLRERSPDSFKIFKENYLDFLPSNWQIERSATTGYQPLGKSL